MKIKFWKLIHNFFHHWHVHWATSPFMIDITHTCYYHAGLRAKLFTEETYR